MIKFKIKKLMEGEIKKKNNFKNDSKQNKQ